jgi:hypothetical protein
VSSTERNKKVNRVGTFSSTCLIDANKERVKQLYYSKFYLPCDSYILHESLKKTEQRLLTRNSVDNFVEIHLDR